MSVACKPVAAVAPAAAPSVAAPRSELVPLLLVTTLALALRLTGLGHESIWYDEAYSLNLAGKPFARLITGAEYDTGNPQAYFLLLHLWQQLWHSSSIETARALSAIAGALCVPAVWLLARRSGASRRVGLLAALLVAVNPSLIFLSQEARTFALFASVATLAAAFVAAIVRGGGKTSAWCGFTACGMVLVHLHYYAAFVLVVLGLYLLLWGRRHAPGTVVKVGLAALAVTVAFAPWLPIFYLSVKNGVARSSETWWQQLALLPLFTAVGRTLVWKTAGTKIVAGVDILVLVLLYLPAAWLLVRTRRSDARDGPWLGPALALGVGLPVLAALISLRTPMLHTHYLTATIPSLMLLIALAVEAGVRRRAWVALAGPLIVLGLIGPSSVVRLYAVQHKENWRALAERVAETAPDLPVYFYEDIGETPYGYYRPNQLHHTLTEPFGETGARWQEVGYFDQLGGEHDGFWFVFYGVNRNVVAEEPRIVAQLTRHFDVDCDADFGRMHLLRCRPRAAVLAQSP
jgi:4-amino-4-deoxy-L-arabinose transferase-like glycosyltransferase